jgi:hypothetical protein
LHAAMPPACNKTAGHRHNLRGSSGCWSFKFPCRGPGHWHHRAASPLAPGLPAGPRLGGARPEPPFQVTPAGRRPSPPRVQAGMAPRSGSSLEEKANNRRIATKPAPMGARALGARLGGMGVLCQYAAPASGIAAGFVATHEPRCTPRPLASLAEMH